MANQPKKYTKFVATAATATLVASAIVPVASAAGFSDVSDTNSHAVNINALAEAGIIGGYPDGTFKPNQELTRGQVVKMLGKWVEKQGFEIPADYATKARFTDLAADAKDQELVKYAALVFDNGVFVGSNGELNAGGKITRENMALVLDRAFKAINDTTLVELAADIEDVKIADLATAKAEARETIQALRDLGISGVENFMPKNSVTRAQFATFLNKTINTDAVVELTVKEAKAVDANTVEVTLSDDTKHTVKLETALEANKETEVKFTIDEKEYTAKVTYVLAVESVKAINAKTLKLTLTAAVDEATQKAAEFTVKRGNAIVSVTAEWAADGKTVELASGANLLAGDYTVTASNIEGEATTSVTAVTPTTLDVAASILNDETAKSKLNVELKDQYGEKIALTSGAFTATAFNKTQGTPVTLGFTTADGYYVDTETTPTAFKVDDVVTVTFIHNATGLKVTKELKVVSGAILSTVGVGAIELPKDKTLLTADLTNVKAELTAKDQFGNAATGALGATGNLTVISSDETVVSASDVTIVTEDEKQKLNIAKIGKSGKVTLTVLVKATGETATFTLDILAAPGEVTSATLEETASTVAAGSTKEVALKVYDNYNNEVKYADYSSVLDVSSSNKAVVPTASINADGKLEFTVARTAGKNSTATINVVDATGKVYASYVVTAGEVAVATSIEVAETSKHSTKLAVNASTTPVFEVKDQYGNKIDAPYPTGYTVTYKSKNDSTNITVDASTGAVTANKVGTASIVAELNKDGVAIASKEIAFTIVENNSTGVQIADIATLAQTTEAAEGTVGAYYEEIKVVSETGAALPAASILSVKSSNEFVEVAEVDGKWYAYGVDVDTVNGKDVDTKATISVVYNADDKPVTLTKEVTVSATPIAVNEILVNDKKLTDTNKVDKDAVTVTSVSVKDFSDLEDLDIFAAVKDNFGRLNAATTGAAASTDVVISINNKVGFSTTDTITVTTDGELNFTALADELATSKDGKASFRVILTKGTVVKAVDVKLTAATTVAQDAAEALETAKSDAAKLVEASYTQATWADLEAALALPETTLAEVQAKTTAINNAIEALVNA